MAFDNSRNDGGASENNTIGRVALKNVANGLPQIEAPTPDPNFPPTQFLNLLGDPFNGNPFQTNSTVDVFNVASFTNDGTGLKWIPFDEMLKSSPDDLFPSTNIHRVVTTIDPVTGLTRLIFGDDQGIFTGVDDERHPGDPDRRPDDHRRDGGRELLAQRQPPARPVLLRGGPAQQRGGPGRRRRCTTATATTPRPTPATPTSRPTAT